ncbi:uncharacterized mitochondrial protein-like protein [Tanacetum coccineum]
MSEFFEQKGIKREFSIARAPQQNSIAERRNKTLIKDARTMCTDKENDKATNKQGRAEKGNPSIKRSKLGRSYARRASTVQDKTGFEDPEFPDRVYKVEKALYSLHQAPRAFQVTPKVLHLHAVKRIFRYLKGQPKLGLWYLKDSPFDLEAYTDSDYAGASLDKKSTTRGLKGLRKISRTARIESSEDEGLGAQEDASKQGRKIADLDADAEVTLVDEAQGKIDDNLMFNTRVFDEEEVEIEKVVSTAKVTTASATTTTVDELTLAQTLIKIKAAKPKAVTTATTTTTTVVTRPKARGVVVQEPTMMEADYELAQRLQAEEQGELTIEERSKLFVELMNKRKKHFAKLRAKEIRRKPPTKAQKRNQMYSFVPMDTEVVEGSKTRKREDLRVEEKNLEY